MVTHPAAIRLPWVPVAVVTDSTHYLPAEVAERHGLHVVSLYVTWAGRTQREADMVDYGGFYGHVRATGELPSTSQPSVGDFLAVYEPLLAAGADLVSIHISGGLSGTCRSAEQARAELVDRGLAPERLIVMDSGTGAAGLGLMAVAAANAAAEGATTAEAAARAQAMRAATTLWFAVDTLEFLRRGGRIGGAQAWLGTALKIKPILSVEREVVAVERVRTSGRAFERLVDFLEGCRDAGADRFVVQHIQAPDEAERLAERGRQLYGCQPEFVSEVGPVIGAHVGPGLLGATGVPGSLLGPL